MRGRGSPVRRGAIFDLDGVLVDTAALHHRAWREICAPLGLDVTASLNERLKGVARGPALDILLEAAGMNPPPEERRRLADAKNARYIELLSEVNPTSLLPGVLDVLASLRSRGVRVAIGSASRNAPIVVQRLGIAPLFDALVDGAMVSRSKPDPQVFLVAAEMLSVPTSSCTVFEDAEAGLQAAKAAGMVAVGVGRKEALPSADLTVRSLVELPVDSLFGGVDHPGQRRPGARGTNK